MQLLLLSNGHGEDAIGALLARRIEQIAPWIRVQAFPLVGVGRAYVDAGVPLVGAQQEMPSGGFVRQGLAAAWRDAQAGLFQLLVRQARALCRLRPHVEWAVAVGDVVPLILAGWFLRKPLVFAPTAKSDYIRPHLLPECALMRRLCQVVFPRDGHTAASLRRRGVRAVYVGNMMMDIVPVTDSFSDAGLDIPPDAAVVALLPGSRAEAYENLRLLLPASDLLATDWTKEGYPPAALFLLALANSLDVESLARAGAALGWTWEAGSGAATGWLVRGHARVAVLRGRFGDVLKAADIAIGMAGTANEQATGMGVPVVSPPGNGPQFTHRFLAAQKRLLGDALAVVPPDPRHIALEVRNILADRRRYEKMQQAGRSRMGGPGATDRIARIIAHLTQEPRLSEASSE